MKGPLRIIGFAVAACIALSPPASSQGNDLGDFDRLGTSGYVDDTEVEQTVSVSGPGVAGRSVEPLKLQALRGPIRDAVAQAETQRVAFYGATTEELLDRGELFDVELTARVDNTTIVKLVRKPEGTDAEAYPPAETEVGADPGETRLEQSVPESAEESPLMSFGFLESEGNDPVVLTKPIASKPLGLKMGVAGIADDEKASTRFEASLSNGFLGPLQLRSRLDLKGVDQPDTDPRLGLRAQLDVSRWVLPAGGAKVKVQAEGRRTFEKSSRGRLDVVFDYPLGSSVDVSSKLGGAVLWLDGDAEPSSVSDLSVALQVEWAPTSWIAFGVGYRGANDVEGDAEAGASVEWSPTWLPTALVAAATHEGEFSLGLVRAFSF